MEEKKRTWGGIAVDAVLSRDRFIHRFLVKKKKIESLRMYGAPLRLFCFGWGQVGSGGPFVAVQGVSRCGKGSHSGHPITMMCSDSNAWND